MIFWGCRISTCTRSSSSAWSTMSWRTSFWRSGSWMIRREWMWTRSIWSCVTRSPLCVRSSICRSAVRRMKSKGRWRYGPSLASPFSSPRTSDNPNSSCYYRGWMWYQRGELDYFVGKQYRERKYYRSDFCLHSFDKRANEFESIGYTNLARANLVLLVLLRKVLTKFCTKWNLVLRVLRLKT